MLRRPTCLRIARRSATARADGRKNWLLASCSGGLPFAVPGVDAPSSDVHAISTLCCDVWMWEKMSDATAARDGAVGKWLIGRWLTSTSTTARRQPLFRWLKTTHRTWKRALDTALEGNVFRRTCLAACAGWRHRKALRGPRKTERDGEGSADGAEGGAGW